MTASDGVNPKNKEKRGTHTAVPYGYETLLTEDQRYRVGACQRFGWELQFIRRPLFVTPTVVLLDSNNNKTWEVLASGELSPFVDSRNL
jgi:hypothetical protein